MNTESYIIIALALVIIALLLVIITRKPKAEIDDGKILQKLDDSERHSFEQMGYLSKQMQSLTNKNYEQQLKLMEILSENAQKQADTLSKSVKAMQDGNEAKLEQMRVTVDEKLTETLNRRISASFEQVSRQLGAVYKSLGEMKELSAGVTTSVTGLNRVLTNVKSRGTWAEVQLGNILDETIPNMYVVNAQTNPKYNGRVEFAVKIPNQENGDCTYLPIDSKFPMEDYARLTAATEIGDTEAIERSRKALEARVRDEAKLIKQYISVPETTPFAIMYLATEGLYAEITSSRSGIAEKLQADGIMLAGPSTITALLNSLAMGFRTIAINQKANEVWKLLGAAKMQYDKFGDLLAKARKKVDEAGKLLDEADHRNEIIRKNLKSVEVLDTGSNVCLTDR